MSKYAFDEDSIRELSRMISTLQKTFSSAHKTLLECPKKRNSPPITSSFNLDYSISPQDYYYIRWYHSYCYIFRHRSGSYSIVCENFTPRNLDLYDPSKTDEFYKTLYGSWTDFNQAKNAFSDVVHDLTEIFTHPLFDIY